MKVAVIYDSLTGNTKKAANLIADGFTAEGHETTVSAVNRIDLAAVGAADLVVLGSWVHGAFIVGQAPALQLRQKLTGVLPALTGKRCVTYCTYALTGTGVLDKMADVVEGVGMSHVGGLLIKRTKLVEGADLLVDRVLGSLAAV
jgi:Flavodoxin domain